MPGLGLTGLYAQETMVSTGGNVTGNEGTVSYSIGQVVYHTHTGSNGSVLEGIQSAYEISEVTLVSVGEKVELNVTVYPNPATDYLILEVKNMELTDLSFQLYNINGKLLQRTKITHQQTNIALSSFVPTTYFVRVFKNEIEVKSFKIIKN